MKKKTVSSPCLSLPVEVRSLLVAQPRVLPHPLLPLPAPLSQFAKTPFINLSSIKNESKDSPLLSSPNISCQDTETNDIWETCFQTQAHLWTFTELTLYPTGKHTTAQQFSQEAPCKLHFLLTPNLTVQFYNLSNDLSSWW